LLETELDESKTRELREKSENVFEMLKAIKNLIQY